MSADAQAPTGRPTWVSLHPHTKKYQIKGRTSTTMDKRHQRAVGDSRKTEHTNKSLDYP